MASGHSDVVIELQSKVGKLLALYSEVLSENKLLYEKVNLLQGKIKAKDEIVKQLEYKLSVANIADSIFSDCANKDEAKRKISSLIKEIDVCMALLND